MQIFQEFYQFCRLLHQDSFELYGPTDEDIIRGALGSVARDRHPALRDYVDGLLTGPHSDDDLLRIFLRTEADVMPLRPEGARRFLTQMREMIDAGR